MARSGWPPGNGEEVAPGPLTGQVALVTGGSRGIGAAIARTLAGEGAAVAITYRSEEEAARGVASDLGPAASSWQGDVTAREDCERVVAGVLERHERLDVLVLNAGVWRGGRIEDLDEADWRAVVDTSLGGAYRMTRAALPSLRAGPWGRIVVISSVIGLIGYAGDSAYASAKAGLFGLTRSLAKELGRDGMTVNAVAPGLVETDMTAALSAGSREQMLARTALHRAGTPGDVAEAVRFLAVAGRYVTGHTLVVDGGLSL